MPLGMSNIFMEGGKFSLLLQGDTERPALNGDFF
jgi:hypothetical protein